MSMSAQHKVCVTMEGAWTLEARLLLKKNLGWWNNTFEYESLSFLDDWLDELKNECEQDSSEKKKFGPYWGMADEWLRTCLEYAILGDNLAERMFYEYEEDGDDEIEIEVPFDLKVQRELLEVMHTENLKIIFSEYIGHLEGEDEEGMDEEDCWDSEPSVYTLSSDGKTFVI